VIGCCAGTLSIPVSEALTDSPQSCKHLTVPPVDGSKVIPNTFLRAFFNDFDGHGRALEILGEAMFKFQSHDVIASYVQIELHKRYAIQSGFPLKRLYVPFSEVLASTVLLTK